jgi:O-antigen ligase
MLKRELEDRVSFILAWGALAVTIVLTDRISTDPVNVGKMVILSVVGFSVFPVLLLQWRELFTNGKLIVIASSSFIFLGLMSIFTSKNTFERGLYGAFSRNTGLITYASLVFIFLAATLISRVESFQKVIKALFLAGVINVIYSLIVASGNDFITWDNPYKTILGTFGNPNFISAFMGIFFTLLAVQIANQHLSTKVRLSLFGLLPLVALTLYLSKSLQGVLVAIFGSVLAIYFYIRSNERLLRASRIYLSAVIGVGIFALAGIFNKGPLSSFLYSYTIDLRGEYWKAGINMGLDNPIFGVGMDSYGTNYRAYRELSATVVPGLDVGTDTAHNVYIDIFAGTGFPGLITYLVMNGFVLLGAVRYLKSYKTFDARFLTLFLCWAAYQLQSIVSINQIGLAVWGWLLGGLIIAYTKSHSNGSLIEQKNQSKQQPKRNLSKDQEKQLLDASSSMKILGGALIGLLIALPPFVTDAKLRNFFSGKSGQIQSVVSLAQSWPVDNIRLNKIITSLARNNQNQEARELAAFAALEFPNDYVSWWALYQLTRDGTPEKEFIRAKLHEIDPFNPAYFNR